jgi:hypothetical protein
VSWISALWAIVALIVGSVPLAAGGTAVYLEHRRYADELAGTAERFDEQLMAYRRMSEILVDRPSDSEMARWLDHDKSHVRMLAMRHYRLSYREVFAHTVLCESSGPDARRGRVVYGPPRYSVYRVLVFLLTGSGVRQFSVMVNFATGLVHDEHRFTFRYDAIASAGVIQRSVRFATARPTFGGEEARRGGPDSDHKALVFARSFRLTLVSSDWFNIQVENFDEGFMDRLHENARTLLELALDTAGITGALHILEAVAAEGKDWIARELNRRSRRFDKYQENLGLPGAPSRDAAANGGRRAPANG